MNSAVEYLLIQVLLQNISILSVLFVWTFAFFIFTRMHLASPDLDLALGCSDMGICTYIGGGGGAEWPAEVDECF